MAKMVYTQREQAFVLRLNFSRIPLTDRNFRLHCFAVEKYTVIKLYMVLVSYRNSDELRERNQGSEFSFIAIKCTGEC